MVQSLHIVSTGGTVNITLRPELNLHEYHCLKLTSSEPLPIGMEYNALPSQ